MNLSTAGDINFKEIIKQEYIKCSKDPVYFLKKYCMIQHPKKGRMLFNLFPFQVDMIKDLLEYDYNIVLKSRQLGISTVGGGFALWLMTFHTDKNVLIIATKQDVAKNLVTKVRFMYQNLPSWLKEDFVEDNRLSLKFKNGSQIKAIASSEDAGRSEALSFLLIDEAAFISNTLVELIWTAAQQTLATGGRALILSTPNGQGNFFHRTWVAAENGENDFNTIRLPWYVHPERNDEWRMKQDRLLGKKDAAQECLAGYHNVVVKDDITQQEFMIRLDDLYNRVVNENKTYKIYTPSGFQKFSTLQKNKKTSYLEIILTNNLKINASLEHKFISNGEIVLAQDLRYNTVLDTVDNSLVKVKTIRTFNEEVELYDIIEVENGNLFVVDGIITHNCDAEFISSGATVIDPSDLDYYHKNFLTEPIERKGHEQELWIWEYPQEGSSYVVCADVARGDGGDNSAFHILEIMDNGLVKQVVEFKAKIDTDSYAKLLFNISSEYNEALLVVENANIGWAVLTKLIELKYKNLYYSYKSDPFIDISSQLKKGYDLKNNDDMIPGFSTTSKTRPVMIERLEEYIRDKTIIIQSKRTHQELQTFIWRNQKAEAMSGYNDDLVLSLSIGIWIRETALRMRQHGLTLTKSAIAGIRRSGGDASFESKAKTQWSLDTQNKNISQEDKNLRWLL